jgi:hypothetical protein
LSIILFYTKLLDFFVQMEILVLKKFPYTNFQHIPTQPANR